MRHTHRLGLTFLLLASACSDCIEPPAAPKLEGRYVLETVNGFPLPAVIATVPPEIIRLTRGVVVLLEGGSFIDTTLIEVDASPFGGRFTDTTVAGGSYTLTDSIVQVVREDGTYSMTWRGDHLERFVDRSRTSATLLDLTLIYRRQ
jgi:hypothetical protein